MMNRHHKVWLFVMVAGVMAASGCTGCQRDRRLPDAPKPNGPSPADLVEFQRQRAWALDSLIDSQTAAWARPERTGTGIRYETLDRQPGTPAVADLTEGTVLELHHSIALLDGRVLSDWTSDGPLAFEPGSTDLPSGFHELIALAHLGDSLRALIPPIRAWGMAGLPPEIPQEAVIAVSMRIDLYRIPA